MKAIDSYSPAYWQIRRDKSEKALTAVFSNVLKRVKSELPDIFRQTRHIMANQQESNPRLVVNIVESFVRKLLRFTLKKGPRADF